MDNITNLSFEVARTVKEDEEKFIFETLTPWFITNHKIVIPKRVLIRAIECFKQEHADEFKILMEEIEN